MNTHLENLILEIIKRNTDEDGITSKVIYDELVSKGEQIPDGAMRRAIDSLIRQRLISGVRQVDRESIETDGGYHLLTFRR